jgi:hypothetical protein
MCRSDLESALHEINYTPFCALRARGFFSPAFECRTPPYRKQIFGSEYLTKPLDVLRYLAYTGSSNMDRQLKVSIPEDLRLRLKVATAAKGVTVREVVIGLVEKWLKRNAKKGNA